VFNILDTNASLSAGTHTWVLVNLNTATNGNAAIEVNGATMAAGSTIDSGTGATLGNSNIIELTTTNLNPADTVGAWSLTVDANGNLDMSVTLAATPEPEHIMLMCVGVLLAGFVLRRRWQQRARSAFMLEHTRKLAAGA
jgi:hypothetical protein